MIDEYRNSIDHPELQGLPDMLVAEIGRQPYTATEYAAEGQEISLTQPEPKNGQMTAELYNNGRLRVHLITPSGYYAERNADLARTRVVTIDAVVPGTQDQANGAQTAFLTTAQTRPEWVGEQHTRSLAIGKDELEKVIVFEGRDNQEPLQQPPQAEKPGSNDFQELIDFLERRDVREAVDDALRNHGRSHQKYLGWLARRIAGL